MTRETGESEIMQTLVICDTEPVAIEGTRRILESGNTPRLIAAETSVPGAMEAIRAWSPTLLLLDKAFGIHAVIDCLKSLQKPEYHTAAIVWGVALPETEALHFLQCGARGAIRKTAPLETLMQCIQTVAAGGTWVEQNAVPRQDRIITGASRSSLTGREMQVMELVERGLKNRDIALALGIRTGTVKIHLKHIFEKTGIHGRFGLALSALKEKGLLAVPVLDIH
jgi:DNA-binding NarL/FixJ family response regulator